MDWQSDCVLQTATQTAASVARTAPVAACRRALGDLAKDLFQGLDGDVCVTRDTILVTYYNAPNQELLRAHYQGFPDKLAAEHIDPRVPWLYGFKLDFRFK